MPLLVTKLHIPRPGAATIARPRLLDRLDEGLNHKLTLISAPDGFGKATVVSRWIAGGASAAAWLSLKEADRDPARFLAYLVATLRTAVPTLGKRHPGRCPAALRANPHFAAQRDRRSPRTADPHPR